MRTSKALVACLLPLALLTGACSDDKADVDAGDDTDQTVPDGSGVEVPDQAPDLVGTITTITPFEPVTEGCTPAEDVDPNAAVSSDDPPPCTPEDNKIVGTILVEEDLAPEQGRKISYTVTTDTTITGSDGDDVAVGDFADFADGQTAETWVSGDACAESYPEQCGLEAIRVTG